jgi:hypothetical protein
VKEEEVSPLSLAPADSRLIIPVFQLGRNPEIEPEYIQFYTVVGVDRFSKVRTEIPPDRIRIDNMDEKLLDFIFLLVILGI